MAALALAPLRLANLQAWALPRFPVSMHAILEDAQTRFGNTCNPWLEETWPPSQDSPCATRLAQEGELGESISEDLAQDPSKESSQGMPMNAEGIALDMIASLQASFHKAEELMGMLGAALPAAAVMRLPSQPVNGSFSVEELLASPSHLVSEVQHMLAQMLHLESAEVADALMPTIEESVAEVVDRYGLAVHGASARREGEGWRLPFVANVFRRNEGRHLLRLAVFKEVLFQRALGIKDLDEEAQKRYEERARLVFRNMELFSEQKGHRLEARLAGVNGLWREISPTDKDGRTEASLWFKDEEVSKATQQELSTSGSVLVEVRLIDRSMPPARVLLPLVGPEGVTVISDIDDTVKVTEVFRGHGKVLENTFFREFRAVDGMPELYKRWATKYGASFEFVSKSPPELHEPLTAFLRNAGFPLSSVHLCSLFSGERSSFKARRITALLQEFPGRRFVLVGDSGEHDAAIYAELARRFPEQILKVLIRQVSDRHTVPSATFYGIEPGKWQVFTDPVDIRLDLPVKPALPISLSLPEFPELFSSLPESFAFAVKTLELQRALHY